MEATAIRKRANELPREPGVYQFMEEGSVRYVGKALDLRDRVRSYADPRGERIRRMVRAADAIDVAVTDTETQALLLEANLIKRHQPRYNVRLKDDKSYPMVQLTDHEAPRIEVTRDPAEGATVFGPFTDVGRTEAVVKALREVFGIRGCSDHKYASRDRPCLDHPLGLCSAPCTREIDLEPYGQDVEYVRRFLEGETGVLADPLHQRMEAAAEKQGFERAAHLRDRLDAVEAFHGGAGGTVSAPEERRSMDVLGVAVEGDRAVVARLHAEGGKLVERDRHVMAAPGEDEPVPHVLAAFVPQYYAERTLPDVLVLSDHHEDDELARWLESEGVSVQVPGAGREARLVDLALRNARQYSAVDELGALAEALDIPRPERIEGFDVSHARGGSVVGSDVVFVAGSAKKADYRRKKLEEQNDDYANLYDLLRWRADRAIAGRDDRPDPNLLLIDGGAGQLEAARDALSDAGWEVPMVALAKGDEVVITPDGTFDWPASAPQLHVLQRVRDEAHRFAVQYHQLLRDDVSTVLDEVPGVGPERRRTLLSHFGSVEGIRSASADELASVPGIGERTAETIVRQL